jgi:hypothetical protein
VTTLAAAVTSVQIDAREMARTFDLARFLLVVLALPFLVLGFAARLVYRVVLLAGIWAWAAVRTGWRLAADSAPASGP